MRTCDESQVLAESDTRSKHPAGRGETKIQGELVKLAVPTVTCPIPRLEGKMPHGPESLRNHTESHTVPCAPGLQLLQVTTTPAAMLKRKDSTSTGL